MRIALIGSGSMGSVHAEAHARNPRAELVGIFDSRLETAEALAERLGTRAYATLEQLMAAENPDIIDICLPTFLHKDYVLLAASYGKHVICEKPIAGSLADARAMIDACREAGVHLYVGHVVRFFPEYAQVRALIQGGEIGEVGTVRTERVSACPRGHEGWYRDFDKSGGVLLDLMLHDFDWLRWTFGEARRVTAVRACRDSEDGPLEYALATLRMEDGTIALIEGSWAHTEFSSSFEIAGTQGMLAENMADNTPLTFRPRRDPGHAERGVIVPELIANKGPLQKELEHFIRCLNTGGDPLITAFDGLKAVEIAEAAIESARTGESITLPRG